MGDQVQPERNVQNAAVLTVAEDQQCRGTARTCSGGNRTLSCHGRFHQGSRSKADRDCRVEKTHIINYAKTRPVYDAYRKSGYSKKFLEAHREEITLHKAAKAAFDEAGLQKLPKVKELDAEFSELLTKKKAAYPDYRKARNEMQELVRAQKNVERFFAGEKDTIEKAQTR